MLPHLAFALLYWQLVLCIAVAGFLSLGSGSKQLSQEVGNRTGFLYPAISALAERADWFVIVTTDRGLYADWLYEKIQSLGWHPFMRINQIGQFKITGQDCWQSLNTLVPQVGQSFRGSVTCFKTN